MKRLIYLILSVLLLLSGCNADVTPTETPTPTVETTAETTEPIDYWQNVKDYVGDIPVYVPGDPLIDHDPDREVFFIVGNEEQDIFPEPFGGSIGLRIYSRQPLTEEEIQVNIPCKTSLRTHYLDGSRSLLPDYYKYQGPFEDYVALCITGADVRQYTLYEQWMFAANILASDSEWSGEKEDAEKYRQISRECEAQVNAIMRELTAPDIGTVPSEPVYQYSLSFHPDLNPIYDETVETIEVILKDKSYTVDVGQWRFHSQVPDEMQTAIDAPVGVEFAFGFKGGECIPYIEYVQAREMFQFTAKEDLTITGCRQPFMENPIHMLGARVQINGSTNTNFYWDLQRPIELKKGDQVTIDLIFKDERFNEYLFETRTIAVLDYEIRGKSHVIPMRLSFYRGGEIIWDPYLLAFEGADIGNYYTCYYRPTAGSWIDELPEAWRESE